MVEDEITDDEIDRIYDEIDTCFREGLFGWVDVCLNDMVSQVDEMHTDRIIAILSITFCAKSKLPSRATLFKAAEESLKKREGWKEGWTFGLE